MNIKLNNNYTIATELFNNILNWAADKSPARTKEQVCADIEKVLELVEGKETHYKKGYSKGYNDGYADGESNAGQECCGNR